MHIPRLLVFDLDGTLLNDDKRIPQESIEEINKLYKEFGVIPVIATARPLEIAKQVAEQGGEAFSHSHIIATNGAIVYDMAKKAYLLKRSLTREALDELIKICKKHKLEFEIMTDEKEIASADYEYRRPEDPIYTNAGQKFAFEENLEEYIKNSEEGTIPLFAISGSSTELATIKKELDRIEGISRTAPNSRGEGLEYYDVMPEGVSKAEALQIILNRLEIEPECVYVFGDGGNDLPILNYGRIGETEPWNRIHYEKGVISIAPANARDAVKSDVDWTTQEDNNSGAIANFLKALRIHLEVYYRLKENGMPTIDNKRQPDNNEGPEL